MVSGKSNDLQVVSFHVCPLQLSPCGTALKAALERLFFRVASRFRAVESFYLPDALYP